MFHFTNSNAGPSVPLSSQFFLQSLSRFLRYSHIIFPSASAAAEPLRSWRSHPLHCGRGSTYLFSSTRQQLCNGWLRSWLRGILASNFRLSLWIGLKDSHFSMLGKGPKYICPLLKMLRPCKYGWWQFRPQPWVQSWWFAPNPWILALMPQQSR